MAEAKQVVLIEGVEARYPRLNQTYKFDRSVPPKGATVPCGPTEENAKYEIKFRMDQSQAKSLYGSMLAAYTKEAQYGANWPAMPSPADTFVRDDDGMYIGTAQIKGQYSGTVTEKPLQVDAKNRKLPDDFELTTGSTVNIAVVLVPYSMATNGVSLRIKAVQVITLVEKKQHSPFGVQDGYSSDSAPVSEQDLFGLEMKGPDTPVIEDDSWVVVGADDSIPEPQKVAKKKEVAAPSSVEADLSSIVDGWDD